MGSDQNLYYLHHQLQQQQQQQQQQLLYASLPSSAPRLLNVQDWNQASSLVLSENDQLMNRYMEELGPNAREDECYWPNNIDLVPCLKTSNFDDEAFLHNTPEGSLSDSFLKLCNSDQRGEVVDDGIDLNQNLWNMNSLSAGLVPCPPSYSISTSLDKFTYSYDQNEGSLAPRNQSRDTNPPNSSTSNPTISTSCSKKDDWRKNKHPKPRHACGEEDEVVAKKPRSVPQSSSPALKVRKEKLGDRVAALHRMVSPFGKTDTASVLTESIGYIQFLQGQIQRLSMTYSKSSCPTTRQGGMSMKEHNDDKEEEKQDLSSRGLCLVPLGFTSYVFSLN